MKACEADPDGVYARWPRRGSRAPKTRLGFGGNLRLLLALRRTVYPALVSQDASPATAPGRSDPRGENTKVPPADWLFGGDYIAAIDMMALEDWTFSENVFRNIRGRNGGGRAAIFIWVRSRRVVVERNLIVDCDRGVAFGNPGQSTANRAGERRTYVSEGVIRNNFIAGGTDCGIELWYVDRIRDSSKTIWRPERNWGQGIRIGTGTTQTEIADNLVTKRTSAALADAAGPRCSNQAARGANRDQLARQAIVGNLPARRESHRLVAVKSVPIYSLHGGPRGALWAKVSPARKRWPSGRVV